jgi:CRP-like cAMP-binding protein
MPSSAARRVSVNFPRSLPEKATTRSPAFKVKLFLDSTGLGRKAAKFQSKQTIFVQGEPATNVIYIQEGNVKLSVVNETGKEAVVAILDHMIFVARAALWASPFIW